MTAMVREPHKGLKLERGGLCPKNYLIPDGVLAPLALDVFAEADSWMEPDGIVLVIEVTSTHADRDRRDERHCYAKGGIPFCLLVDREQRTVSLFSEPRSDEGREDYLQETRVIFGKPLEPPEPFSFTLDTSELSWPRVRAGGCAWSGRASRSRPGRWGR